MSIRELIIDYLEYCELERNRSKKTLTNYAHYLERFAEYGEKHKTTSPSEITLDLVRQYRLFLNANDKETGEARLKKITQNYHLIALRNFLRYLAKKDVVSLSVDKIELMEPEAREVTILNLNQLEDLLARPNTESLEGKRDKAILEVLFSTGLRVSELAKLNRGEIDLVRREFSVVGKRRKRRVVFLSRRAAEFLKVWLEEREDSFEPLFIRLRGSRVKVDILGSDMRLSVRGVQRLVRKYSIMAGISLQVTPHTLRHSFATDLLLGGADIRAVQELLGHESITTTQIYTHFTNRELREAHEKHHGIRTKGSD